MSNHDVYSSMVQARGAAYRADQVTVFSHYDDPIDHGKGRLAGRTHVWGDASPEVQSRVIDSIVSASRQAGLDAHQTAYVLAIARVESGFNPDAAAGTTSAYGLGQFIDQTAAHYGIDDNTRGDVGKQAEALVAYYVDNAALAKSRHQGEAYIYKYHHDGPTRDYGGLAISEREVMPYVAGYKVFVKQHWPQLDHGVPVSVHPHIHTAEHVLHQGARGEAVVALQSALANLGYTGSQGHALRTDGEFGTNTLRAVEAFQHDHGLTVDGKAGPLTRQALKSASHPEQAAVPVRGASSTTLPGFDSPAHPQHGMYEYLKGILPTASDERFHQATAACHVAGIDKPEDLSAVHITDSKALFSTSSLFANMAEMDISKPAPAVQQSLQQVQQFDQPQQMQTQQTTQQQAAQGPVMHY